MKPAKYIIITLFCITFISCASRSVTGKDVILISNPALIENCKSLGKVHGSDHAFGGAIGKHVAQANARKRAQNMAGEMGADIILIVSETKSFSGGEIVGEAYKCAEK
jgi:hypothetical protein